MKKLLISAVAALALVCAAGALRQRKPGTRARALRDRARRGPPASLRAARHRPARARRPGRTGPRPPWERPATGRTKRPAGWPRSGKASWRAPGCGARSLGGGAPARPGNPPRLAVRRRLHEAAAPGRPHSTRTMAVGLKPRSAALPLRPRAARALFSERISSVSSRSLPPRPTPEIFTLRV